MSPPTPCCPSRTHVGWRYAPVRTVRDALDVVASVAAAPPRPETIAVLMDSSRQGGLCYVVSGTVDASSINDVAEFVLVTAAANVVRVDSVVLASVRPGRLGPADNDHWRWFELRDRFDEAGIDLLDWFVRGDAGPISMAQLTDSRSLW